MTCCDAASTPLNFMSPCSSWLVGFPVLCAFAADAANRLKKARLSMLIFGFPLCRHLTPGLTGPVSQAAPEPFGGAKVVRTQPPNAERELKRVEDEAEGEAVDRADLSVKAKAVAVGDGGEHERMKQV